MADISARQQSLNRRRQLAAALQQQSMVPLEQPSMPGANMSITQPLAKIAQALFASLGNRKLDKQQEALTGELTADRTAAAQAVVPRGTGEYQVMDSPVGEAATMERLAGPQDQSNRAAMVAALAGGDPQAQEMAQTQLQNQTMDRRQNAGNAERMVQMLAGQKFDMSQLNAQQAQQSKLQQQQQDFTSGENALNREATAANQNWKPGDYVRDGKGGFIQLGDQTKTLNLGSLSEKTVLYKGTPTDVLEDRDMQSPTKGKIFLQTPQGLKDITGETAHYRPPSSLESMVITPTSEAPVDMQDAVRRALVKASTPQAARVIENVNQQVKRGDIASARSTIKQAALEFESAPVRNQVNGRREAMGALKDIKALLKEVSPNLITGTIEDTARKLGTSSDPKLVKIGGRLLSLNQSYRKGITGAQFSQQESAEYQRLFPSYSNMAPVNDALIDSLNDSFSLNDRIFWDNKLGPGWTDAAPQQSNQGGIAVKPGGALEALINARKPNAPR